MSEKSSSLNLSINNNENSQNNKLNSDLYNDKTSNNGGNSNDGNNIANLDGLKLPSQIAHNELSIHSLNTFSFLGIEGGGELVKEIKSLKLTQENFSKTLNKVSSSQDEIKHSQDEYFKKMLIIQQELVDLIKNFVSGNNTSSGRINDDSKEKKEEIKKLSQILKL